MTKLELIYFTLSLAVVIMFTIIISVAMLVGDGTVVLDFNSINEGYPEMMLSYGTLFAGIFVLKKFRENRQQVI